MIFIIAWKEFKNRKMENRAEVVKEDDEKTAINKMIQFNSQQRLTTVDYAIFDLNKLLEDKGLEISEKVSGSS